MSKMSDKVALQDQEWHCLLKAYDTGEVDEVFALVTLDKKTAAFFLRLRNSLELIKSTVKSVYRLEIWYRPDNLYSSSHLEEWDEEITEYAGDSMQMLARALKPPDEAEPPRGDAFVARVSDSGVSFKWNPKHSGWFYFYTNEIPWKDFEDVYNGVVLDQKDLFKKRLDTPADVAYYYAIQHESETDDETGEPLWWSNYWGWGSREGASVWESPHGPVPLGGLWVHVSSSTVRVVDLSELGITREDECWHEPGQALVITNRRDR